MRRAHLAWGSIAIVLLLGVATPRTLQDLPLWSTGDSAAPTGVLHFTITDSDGAARPARLTFVRDDDPVPSLFPNTAAAPEQLAVRKNVVYALEGRGRITVPVGRYRVFATAGIEWSRVEKAIDIRAEAEVRFVARLRREIDTSGWINGDFHLHTLTYSGHGDSNMDERIISLLGEGVELAVATDHDHNTDYGPTLTARGGTKRMTAIVGNEVSTSIGHFNAFPLDPQRPVIDSSERDARELFRIIRAEPNAHGVIPIVQVNHPRWEGIDYFGKFALDPVTGETDAEAFDWSFDTIEIFNSNEGYGYDDEETRRDSGNRYWVLGEWFRMLNTGRRAFAVGNSDSHTVHATFAGYPRNYVRYEGPASPDVDVPAVLRGIRAGQMSTTTGPFVELSVGGQLSGGRAVAEEGRVVVGVRVQAASWIDCDRVRLVVNGDVVETWPVAPGRSALRFEKSHSLMLAADAWVTVLVEGDDSLHPIVADRGRPTLPRAVANPIWVDADGDGEWTAPSVQAETRLSSVKSPAELEAILAAAPGPEQRSLLLWVASRAHPAIAGRVAARSLVSPEGRLALTAARVVERVPVEGAVELLDKALGNCQGDPELRTALIRALAAYQPERLTPAVQRFLADEGVATLQRYIADLQHGLSGRTIGDWMALGPFPNEQRSTLYSIDYGPESDASLEREYPRPAGPTVQWKPLKPSSNGFADLISATGGGRGLALLYAQTHLHVDSTREVMFALGTDDGCRLYVGDRMVYEDRSRHAASPWRHMGLLRLEAGWNRILLKVENGGGDSGFYFKIFDDEVRWQARIDERD